MTAPLEAVMRSVVDGPLIGLLAPPLSLVSGAGRAGPGESAETAASNIACVSACLFL